MKVDSHNCADELRGYDLKVTPRRMAMIKLLEDSDKPLDLFDITKHLSKKGITIDPATAFRIISLFAEKGIAKKLQFLERKFRYELFSKSDHHHLICRGCDSVRDIEDRFMTDWEKEITSKEGFLVTNHNLEFFGLCELCQH